MTPRERVLAALKGEPVDKIPFTAYDILVPKGRLGEELKKMGLTPVHGVSVFREKWTNVRVRYTQRGDYVYTVYETPVGSVTAKHRVNLQPGTGDYWTVEHPIKRPEDYKVIDYIYRNAVIEPLRDEEVLDQMSRFGEDCVVRAWVDRTPIQKMLIELAGYRRLSVDLYRSPEFVDELYETLTDRLEKMCEIVSESPVELVWCGDNVNGIVLGPKVFEKYHLPIYRRMASILRRGGKTLMVHMDGKLNCLKHLIPASGLEVIEAFTPPPMGDLPVGEARSLWGEGVKIWINFPETVLLGDEGYVRRYTSNLLREIAPGRGFLIGITEDIAPGYEDRLKAVAEVLNESGRYPINI